MSRKINIVTHLNFFKHENNNDFISDLETPKRQSRNRFNGCSTGDSPSEADALQDIIWDPASPTPVWNGKGAGEGVRVVEISDIVNRIAPKVSIDFPVDKDLVLQWIGDSAIPCTPEIQQPRVRRISARRQSNNVEDLMKLAKQFDINMTRQDEERQLENKGRNTEGSNKLDRSIASHSVLDGIEPSGAKHFPVPAKPEVLSHEEELHALFDGPTQYLSGRLSPPSVNGSQESRTESAALDAKKPDTAGSKNFPEDAAQVPKSVFDDDWDNDDLLNDSFVLEMTQNPDLSCSCPKKTGSVMSSKCEPTNVASSSGSGSRASFSPLLLSSNSNRYTRTLSKAPYTNPSTFRPQPVAPVNTGIAQQLPKTSPDPAKMERSENNQAEAQIFPCKRGPVSDFDRTKREIKGIVGAKKSDSLTGTSGKDFKTLDWGVWGDGDDDLLYQACDDVERISASQEEQKQNSCADFQSNKPTKAPSSKDTTCFSNNFVNDNTQPGQPREPSQVTRIFGRSHSIPAALNPQWTIHEVSTHSQSAESTFHHSTFKRHQSDPVPLAQPVVKCTAAEIERKKQEAIARRRFRLQTNQNPGAPT
uniref:ETAA1 activator of ATR kinase b n=1 Tax=Pygocentrus nattereri TaxID=42514 RepID=A0AAR2KE27_PYGNA